MPKPPSTVLQIWALDTVSVNERWAIVERIYLDCTGDELILYGCICLTELSVFCVAYCYSRGYPDDDVDTVIDRYQLDHTQPPSEFEKQLMYDELDVSYRLKYLSI